MNVWKAKANPTSCPKTTKLFSLNRRPASQKCKKKNAAVLHCCAIKGIGTPTNKDFFYYYSIKKILRILAVKKIRCCFLFLKKNCIVSSIKSQKNKIKTSQEEDHRSHKSQIYGIYYAL